MILLILNYSIKIIIIAIGIVFLAGIWTPPNADQYMTRVLGVVMILFGIYRLIAYRTGAKRKEREDRYDKEN